MELDRRTVKEMWPRARKMAPYVEVRGAKPEELSSAPGVHMERSDSR